MESKNKNSYRNILKGTAIFGGVQVINILINVLRGKFVAMFLGPSGMGVSSLLTSTINSVQQFSSLGLNFSAVKEISQKYESEDLEGLAKTVKIFRLLVLFTGVLGGLLSICASLWLSRFAFGNNNYVLSFVVLSLVLFFTALASGDIALLQGVRKLKYLAKSSLFGPIVGLIFGTPLYYFFGINGIVPAMVILAFTTFLVNRYFVNKLNISKAKISYADVKIEGKKMISLGVIMMIATLIGTVSVNLVNAFINHYGSIDDVGFFQSATSISNQYVGLVFSAMAIDYFPRLAAISSNNTKVRRVVNHQSEIILLVVAPLVVALIVTAPYIIKILLTNDFLVITPLLRWMALGVFFKAASFPLGYISFSKGDKRFFFWFEAIFSNFVSITCNIIGYILGGLVGLGISFLISYVTYYVLIIFLVRKRYKFCYNVTFLKIFTPLFVLCLLSFLFSFATNQLFFYIIESLLLSSLCLYSYFQLDKRIEISNLLKKINLKK